MKFFKHLKTITKHRNAVIRHAFMAGIPLRGLLHDLSKYMPCEFMSGAKYYVGTRSPNEIEREKYGYSKAWLHHKGRNKHHFEYWCDYDPVTKIMRPVEMPEVYLIEMFCDRVAACKIYKGKDYQDDAALLYYLRGNAKNTMHPNTAVELERLLRLLADEGEAVAFAETKRLLKAWKEKDQ
jgi:hypothetical protein